jgi:glycosyltransferase involved in cell wall biosynthesis
MNTSESSVSAIIPAYNAAPYLAEAVESILGQNYQPLEILIVDDGSTDGTPEVASRFAGSNVRYIRQPHSGSPFALNNGLRNAGGNLICFLDSDDVWTPDKLALQVPLIMQDATVEIVLSHQRRMWRPKGSSDYRFTEPELALHPQSCVFRRSVFDKVGLFDTSFKYTADWDWFMRARELGVKFVVHLEVTNYYRRHDNNLTNDNASAKDVPLMLKRSLERRRARGGTGIALSLPSLLESLRASAGPAASTPMKREE